MNNLTLLDNFLIGSTPSLEALKTKEHARVLVASDSHGNKEILSLILKQYGPTCNAFCFCGDGLGDIAYIYNKALNDTDFQNCLPSVIAYVQGNCDPSSYPLNNGEELIAPPFQTITVNNKGIMVVHGHREGVTYGFEKYGMKLQYCEDAVKPTTGLFGHTHIAEDVIDNNFKFINPGSCTSPRGGQPKSFAILTVENAFIDTAFLEILSYKDDKLDCKLWTPN